MEAGQSGDARHRFLLDDTSGVIERLTTSRIAEHRSTNAIVRFSKDDTRATSPQSNHEHPTGTTKRPQENVKTSHPAATFSWVGSPRSIAASCAT